MKTIYKYQIRLGYETKLSVPEGSYFVHLDIQEGKMFIWMHVDTKNALESRTFKIYGTGWEIEDTSTVHVGSAIHEQFVWHVFETTQS